MKRNFKHRLSVRFVLTVVLCLMIGMISGCGKEEISNVTIVETSEIQTSEAMQTTESTQPTEETVEGVYSGEPDTSWYTEGATEFTLTTPEQLMGFVSLRDSGVGFDGITIKLGNDITINSGTSEEIKASKSKMYKWTVNASYKKPFKGTFDGQGYTISGVYMPLASGTRGMFGSLGGNAVIQNLTIDNSYVGIFVNEAEKIGVLASIIWDNSNVRLSDVTVNALVEEGPGVVAFKIGGFVGAGGGKNAALTMENCVFGGNLTIAGESAGGLIGYVTQSTANVILENCENAGTVAAGNYAGDMIGYANAGKITLTECSGTLNTPIGGINKAKVNGGESTSEEAENDLADSLADTSWYTGTAVEYTLTTVEQLLGFQKLRKEENSFEGITIKLGADITINEGTAEDIKERGSENIIWANLASANEFRGTFNGQGHTISGLYMKLGTAATRGMFGSLGQDAVIKNFNLVNSYFCGPTKDGKNTLGAIASLVTGNNVQIINVNCNAVLEEGKGSNLSYVGGFVGKVVQNGAFLTMKNCTFGGNITITGKGAGGMIGYVNHQKVSVRLEDCTNQGTVTAGSYAGDMIGYAVKGTIVYDDCSGTMNTLFGKVDSNKTFVLDEDDYVEPEPDTSLKPDTSWYTGNATEYVLTTAEQLAGFQQLRVKKERFEGVTIKLGNDITIEEGTYVWPAVGSSYPFKGTFNGQGYTISGVNMNLTSGTRGMFGMLGDGAVLQNFTLDNSYIVGPSNRTASAVGAIASGITEGSTVKILDITCNAVVKEGTSSTTSTSMSKVGGFIGAVDAKNATLIMERCTFSGNVTVTGDYAGGMLGYANKSTAKVTLTDCVTIGAVNANEYAGDMIGYANGGTVALTDCVKGSGSLLGGRNTANEGKGTLVITIIPSEESSEPSEESSEPSEESSDPSEESSEPSEESSENVYSGTPDTSWYTGAATEYTLTTAEQLMGFMTLRSGGEAFNGITIKLGNDITINQGTAEEIKAKGNNNYSWTVEASYKKPFEGTFDGGNHTISGVYMPLASGTRGMFGSLGGSAVVQNFTLDNSYVVITADKDTIGVIASTIYEGGNVQILNVTCNAIVEEGTGVTASKIGGFLGTGGAKNATLTMKDCTFGGKVTITGDYAGGMIGYITQSTAKVILENCKNTGTISAESNDGDMIGYANAGTITVTDCTGNSTLIGGRNTTNEEKEPPTLTITITTSEDGDSEPSEESSEPSEESSGSSEENEESSDNSEENEESSGSSEQPTEPGFEPSTEWYKEPTGTNGEYVLTTAEDLMGFQLLRQNGETFEGKTIMLGENITINEGDVAAIKANENKISWEVSNTEAPFTGTFDGNGKTISGVYMPCGGSNRGMFGVLGDGAVIKNFTLNNSYLVGPSNGNSSNKSGIGVIASYIASDSSAVISGVTCNVVIEKGSDTLNYTGGFVGKVTEDGASLTVENCSFNGDVAINGKGAGGIIGSVNNNASVTLKNCAYKGTISAGSMVGDMIGYAKAGTVTMTDCKSLDADGKVDIINDKSLIGQIDSGAAVTINSVYSGTVDSSWYDTTGTVNEYVLYTADELMGFNKMIAEGTTFEECIINLAVDVIINEDGATNYPWSTVSTTFLGTFNGNGHTISGIYMQASGDAQGMFGVLGDKAVIQNFTLKDSSFDASGYKRIGAIAGNVADGGTVTISGITCKAVIENGGQFTGGLIGSVYIDSSNATTTLIMENCTFSGSVSGTGQAAGGTIGYICNSGTNVTLKGCTNTGTISIDGQNHIGGVIGYIAAAKTVTLESCTNTGAISGKSNVGGMIGYIYNSDASVTLDKCTNTGSISVTSSNEGEIIGYARTGDITLTDCSGKNNTLVGNDKAGVTINNS